MISRSPTWTSVMFSLAIAERSSLVAPSRWIVMAWLSLGLLTVTVLTGDGLEPCGPPACANTTRFCMQRFPQTVIFLLVLFVGMSPLRQGQRILNNSVHSFECEGKG